MNCVLHLFSDLTEESNYYQRILALNQIAPQYILSCDKSYHENFKIQNFQRVPYFNFPKLEFFKEFYFKRSVVSCFEKTFKNIPIELLHSYFAYPHASGGRALANKYSMPHIITVRGSDVLVYLKSGGFLKRAIKKNLNSANKILCVSNHLKMQCIQLGVDTDKIIHLPDGHDENLFFYKQEQREPVILFVGNLVSVKNPIFLLRAFKLFLTDNPDYKLRIIGQGVLKTQMMIFVKENHLTDSVEFLGQLSPELVALHMRKSKVLFLPSLSEGWPNVIQEALACGLPVVATKVGGIPEMVFNNKNGILMDASVEEASFALNKAVYQSWKLEDLLDLPSQYTRTKIIKRLENIYKQITDEHKLSK